ncbi:MAG TPA: addiction module antidote protein, HigA family [Deltaproteobacteria bacterium]|nr:addiction module antidote protein, HigA family [Deltaproteobacteria bacterium]
MPDIRIPPIHPGEILREEFLEPLGMSAYALAQALGVSRPTANDVVREKRGISPNLALRLGRYFNTSAEFWLNLQRHYDLETEREKSQAEIEAIVPLPIEDGARL